MVKVQVSIGQRSVLLVCKVDTGAEGNVIPVSLFKELCPDSPCDSSGARIGLTPSTTTITAFGGNNVQHYDTCTLNLEHDGRSKSYPFHVVNAGGPTILGLPTCTDMNLVTLRSAAYQLESSRLHLQAPLQSALEIQKLRQSYSHSTQTVSRVSDASKVNSTSLWTPMSLL